MMLCLVGILCLLHGNHCICFLVPLFLTPNIVRQMVEAERTRSRRMALKHWSHCSKSSGSRTWSDSRSRPSGSHFHCQAGSRSGRSSRSRWTESARKKGILSVDSVLCTSRMRGAMSLALTATLRIVDDISNLRHASWAPPNPHVYWCSDAHYVNRISHTSCIICTHPRDQTANRIQLSLIPVSAVFGSAYGNTVSYYR